MIFKTFDGNNGFLSKIGVLNKSFAEIGKACGKAFNTSVTDSNKSIAIIFCII